MGQAGKGSSEQADAFQREPGKVASPLASLPAFLEHDAPRSPEPIFCLSCPLLPSSHPTGSLRDTGAHQVVQKMWGFY